MPRLASGSPASWRRSGNVLPSRNFLSRASTLPAKWRNCYPCLRNEMSPMSRVGQDLFDAAARVFASAVRSHLKLNSGLRPVEARAARYGLIRSSCFSMSTGDAGRQTGVPTRPAKAISRRLLPASIPGPRPMHRRRPANRPRIFSAGCPPCDGQVLKLPALIWPSIERRPGLTRICRQTV